MRTQNLSDCPQTYLPHEVVPCQRVLIPHIKHNLIICRLDPEREAFLPYRIECLLLHRGALCSLAPDLDQHIWIAHTSPIHRCQTDSLLDGKCQQWTPAILRSLLLESTRMCRNQRVCIASHLQR